MPATGANSEDETRVTTATAVTGHSRRGREEVARLSALRRKHLAISDVYPGRAAKKAMQNATPKNVFMPCWSSSHRRLYRLSD